LGANAWSAGRFDEAQEILEEMSLSDRFEEFLTLPAYKKVAQL
jgi:malate synthase